jgi:O-antigen/teichoic acid export membrane protein
VNGPHSKQLGRLQFWDLLVGLPAGLLIFMATVTFTTLASLKAQLPVFVPYLILIAVTLVTGLLVGLTRLRQGPATAFCAGLVAAGLLLYLWLSARPGETFNPLVIGPLGSLTTLILCPAGGWLGARLRKTL